jgi:hypothetical protein
MFGSEYNWLITPTRPTNGTLRVRLAGGGLVTLAIASCCLLAVALHAL